MIIGPWSHVNLDKLFIKPLKPTHLRDSFTFFQHLLPFWWYEHWLKGNITDLQKVPPIQIFILNKNLWREFTKWPPNTKVLKFYLHSTGKSNSIYGDGNLTETTPKDELFDEFIFDPSNPVYTHGGRNLFLLSGPQNQINIEKREDVLVYTSEPLKQGIEIIGEVKIVLYCSTNVKDTDFMVKLVDVFPNNKKAINIIDSGIRTHFRENEIENPKLIESGNVFKYEITVGSTAIYFPKNHKIRLEIASSNFPRFDVNSNLAGVKKKLKYTKAIQRAYHDEKYQSHLILPIYKKDQI